MYLDEVPEGQLRDDLAAVIEEVLHQRIQGVKNEKGVFITPAFPKLIYVCLLYTSTDCISGKFFQANKLLGRKFSSGNGSKFLIGCGIHSCYLFSGAVVFKEV